MLLPQPAIPWGVHPALLGGGFCTILCIRVTPRESFLKRERLAFDPSRKKRSPHTAKRISPSWRFKTSTTSKEDKHTRRRRIGGAERRPPSPSSCPYHPPKLYARYATKANQVGAVGQAKGGSATATLPPARSYKNHLSYIAKTQTRSWP